MSEFKIIKSSTGNYREKGSRFNAIAEPSSSIEDVKSKLFTLKKQFQDASHICYAYRIKSGKSINEMTSDAGEPKGSAGIPILNVLKC